MSSSGTPPSNGTPLASPLTNWPPVAAIVGSLPGALGSARRESESESGSESESERRNIRTRILLCSFFIVLEVYRLSFFVFRLSLGAQGLYALRFTLYALPLCPEPGALDLSHIFVPLFKMPAMRYPDPKNDLTFGRYSDNISLEYSLLTDYFIEGKKPGKDWRESNLLSVRLFSCFIQSLLLNFAGYPEICLFDFW